MESNTALLILKGALSELPPEEQAQHKAAYEEIKNVMIKHGQISLLSMGFLGIEAQEKSFWER